MLLIGRLALQLFVQRDGRSEVCGPALYNSMCFPTECTAGVKS